MPGGCSADTDCSPPTTVCEIGQCVNGCALAGGVACVARGARVGCIGDAETRHDNVIGFIGLEILQVLAGFVGFDL